MAASARAEALGFRFNRDMDIVRNGELEATNYFYSAPGAFSAFCGSDHYVPMAMRVIQPRSRD
jgi:hypothetical protein